jgi:hypothetical protein
VIQARMPSQLQSMSERRAEQSWLPFITHEPVVDLVLGWVDEVAALVGLVLTVAVLYSGKILSWCHCILEWTCYRV